MTYLFHSRFRLLLLFTGLGIGLFSCDNDDDEADLVDEPNTVTVEIQESPDFSILSAAIEKANLFEVLDVGTIISSEEDLSTLTSALERTGLSSTLADGRPYTIFAPTNAALELLLEELEIEGLDEVPTDQLTRILQYHVVAGQTFSTELEAGSVNTLLDEDFTVAFSNAIVLANDVNGNDNAVVVAGNLLGTNGVVHVIDRVLRPE